MLPPLGLSLLATESPLSVSFALLLEERASTRAKIRLLLSLKWPCIQEGKNVDVTELTLSEKKTCARARALEMLELLLHSFTIFPSN